MKELEKLRDRQLDIEEVEGKIILILSKVTFYFSVMLLNTTMKIKITESQLKKVINEVGGYDDTDIMLHTFTV